MSTPPPPPPPFDRRQGTRLREPLPVPVPVPRRQQRPDKLGWDARLSYSQLQFPTHESNDVSRLSRMSLFTAPSTTAAGTTAPPSQRKNSFGQAVASIASSIPKLRRPSDTGVRRPSQPVLQRPALQQDSSGGSGRNVEHKDENGGSGNVGGHRGARDGRRGSNIGGVRRSRRTSKPGGVRQSRAGTSGSRQSRRPHPRPDAPPSNSPSQPESNEARMPIPSYNWEKDDTMNLDLAALAEQQRLAASSAASSSGGGKPVTQENHRSRRPISSRRSHAAKSTRVRRNGRPIPELHEVTVEEEEEERAVQPATRVRARSILSRPAVDIIVGKGRRQQQRSNTSHFPQWTSLRRMVQYVTIPASVKNPAAFMKGFSARFISVRLDNVVYELDAIPQWQLELWDMLLLPTEGVSTAELVQELIYRYKHPTIGFVEYVSGSPTSHQVFGAEIDNTSVAIITCPSDSVSEQLDVEAVVRADCPALRSANSIRRLGSNALFQILADLGMAGPGVPSVSSSTKTMKTMISVLLIVEYWIKFRDGGKRLSESPEALSELESFAREIHNSKGPLAKAATVVYQLLQMVLVAVDSNNIPKIIVGALTLTLDEVVLAELLLAQSPPPVPDKHRPKLSDFSPRLAAGQLTLMVYRYFYTHITLNSLVSSRTRKETVALQQLVKFFQTCSWWPLTYILIPRIGADERLRRFIYLIEFAEELRALNNFHALFAIVSGLAQPFAIWLWDLLPKSFMNRFERLRRAVSPADGYRVYKADLSKCVNQSQIPFLGFVTRVLVPLEDINAEGEAVDGMVDYGRIGLRFNAMNAFLAGQDKPYIPIRASASQVTVQQSKPSRSPFNLLPRRKASLTSAHSSESEAGGVPSFRVSSSGNFEVTVNYPLQAVVSGEVAATRTEKELKAWSLEAQSATDGMVYDTLEAAGFLN